MSAIKIYPKSLLSLLLSIVIILVSLNFIFFWLESNGIGSFRFNSLFYLNEESNIPTYFSGLNLLLASLISFFISKDHDLSKNTKPRFWKLLAIVFLFLSFDEVAMFHERIYRITLFFTENFGTSLVWYIPYGIFVVIGIIFLFRDFLSLDIKSKKIIAASGIIFISGAIGMEHFSNNCDMFMNIKCSQNILFALASLEESLEMVAICLFNFASVRLLSGKSNYINLKIIKPNI